jgi:hypothetical protein
MLRRGREPERPGSSLGPLRTDDRGMMTVLMFGLFVLLLAIAGLMVRLAGRPLPQSPTGASQDAALAGAVVLRHQALQEGIRASDIAAAPQQFDESAACEAASRLADSDGYAVTSCVLLPDGLTVVAAKLSTAESPGLALATAKVALVDAPGDCLALRTDWGTTLPPACPTGPAAATGSSSTV